MLPMGSTPSFNASSTTCSIGRFHRIAGPSRAL
jgi:hypothetical protein